MSTEEFPTMTEEEKRKKRVWFGVVVLLRVDTNCVLSCWSVPHSCSHCCETGNSGAKSLFPMIMLLFPCVQLLAAFSKSILSFFFINRLWLCLEWWCFQLKYWTPSLSWHYSGQVMPSWPMRLKQKFLGATLGKVLKIGQTWLVLSFAFWPFSGLLAWNMNDVPFFVRAILRPQDKSVNNGDVGG